MGPRCEILVGDVLHKIGGVPDQSVQVCVTSPPYWGLRDYQVEEQIGLEPTPEEFVQKLVEVFREVQRVLKKDGTLWLNLGDSYIAHRGQRKTTDKVGPKQETNRGSNSAPSRHSLGLKAKDLCGIPWRVAFALQADGWRLRQDIIWSKPNPMPESVTDRCTKAHEYLFLLTKSARYYYDAEAIKEKAIGWNNSQFDVGKTFVHQDKRCQIRTYGKHSTRDPQSPGRRIVENVKRARAAGADHESPFGEARNKRSVWTIATQPYPEAHFATFPEALVEPCILAGSQPRDLVLDPFSGAGTSGVVAIKLARRYIGIELNPEYAKMSEHRIAPLLRQGDMVNCLLMEKPCFEKET